jgi:hypothetical protein
MQASSTDYTELECSAVQLLAQVRKCGSMTAVPLLQARCIVQGVFLLYNPHALHDYRETSQQIRRARSGATASAHVSV